MMGERLAQEAVGLSYLSGHDDWMEGYSGGCIEVQGYHG